MPEINNPAVVAEVTACCEAYERALVANDVGALSAFFWDSAHTIRFGMAEELYGAAAIAEFRKNRVINFSGRKVLRLSVLTLGHDVAVAMLEFQNNVEGQLRRGRQSQVWARLPGQGWRVTSAHVSRPLSNESERVGAQVDAAAAVLGLPIAAEHRPGVVRALQTSAALAAPLLAFALPTSAEIAPVFTP